MKAADRLALVMEIGALRHELEVQRNESSILKHQVDSCMEMFQRILALALERDPEIHAAIVALFEQDIKEMEDAMGSSDADDALGAYDSQTGSAAAQRCDQQSGEGSRG